jgi:hypothetical protein
MLPEITSPAMHAIRIAIVAAAIAISCASFTEET